MMPRAILVVAGAVALGVASGCRPAELPSPDASGSAPAAVRAAPVTAEKLPILTESPATVRPAERAVIAARLAGTVAELPWGLGQEVQAGQRLIALAAPEAEARVRQAQAQLAEATRATERERTLVTKGVNAPDSLRDAEDRLRFAQATLAEADALLALAEIRAPFTGVVTEKNVLPGDLATPGLPLLTLESRAHLRAEGTVPEQAARTLRVGDRVGVVLGDGTTAVDGRVEELSESADAISRSVLVKVALPPDLARSGQFARLQVVTGEREALLVPSSAVTRFGQMERVFVVVGSRALLRLVKTGRVTGERTEILAGVDADERVVLAPGPALRDGQAIRVQP